MSADPHRVVIAGGGVAGLEALLALRALAADRVQLTLVSPAADFFYRPLAVDGTSFPVKHGGLAAEQADAAAADIAAAAGAVVERTPFRPVLRAQVLTPSGPCYLRHDAAGGSGEGEASAQPLWLPPGKIAGRWLAPWLAAVDDRAAPARLPRAGGLPVQIDLHRDVIRP
jgi:hypothetical protein